MLAEIPPSNIGGLEAVLAAIVPIVVGGVTTHFRLFLPAQEEFRNRTKLRRTVLCEKMATRLTALLHHVLCLMEDDSLTLRGDGREQPDLVGEYAEESLRILAICHRLDMLDRVLRYVYYLLYGTVVLGLAGAILAWLVPLVRPWVLGASIALVGMQVLTVLLVQVAKSQLDDYEDVT